jgi:hypothetical protein
VFHGQQIWNCIGNWLVEAHIHGNTQASETGTLEAGVSLSSILVAA